MDIQTDLGRLFKHSSIYAFGGIINRIGAFLLLPLYTNYLSIAEYGTLELVYSTASIVSSLLAVGVAHATLRFYFEYTDLAERRRLVSTSLIGSFVIVLCGIIILWMLGGQLSKKILGSAESIYLIQLTLLIIVFELSTQIGYAYFRAKEYSQRFVFASLLQLIIQVIANYYTVAILGKGVEGVLMGNLLSVVLVWIYAVGVTTRECGLKFEITKFKNLLAYSFPFLLSSIVSVVLSRADRFLLMAFYSLEAVGIYALALKFISLIDVIFSEPFKNSYGAFRFSIIHQANAKELQSRIVVYVAAAVGFLALGISGFAINILRLLSPSQYWDAASIIPILAIGAIIGSVIYPFQTGILYAKKTRYVFYVSLIASLTQILLNVSLIPRFGAFGAALAVVLIALITALSVNWFSQRFYTVDYNYRDLAKVGGLCGFLMGVLWLLQGERGAFSVLAKGIALLSYPACLVMIGCFRKEELEGMLRFALGLWRRLWPITSTIT